MSDPADPSTAISPTAQTQVPAAPDTEATRVPVGGAFGPPGVPMAAGYTIVREIARGGMGVVYLARDPAFERDVAVKVMHPGQDAGRFVIEARVTAQLPHPGIPPVYALGTLPDGRPFLAMKLIAGRTLAAELRSDSDDLPRQLDTFQRIAQTVGFAHARGVIHRDLKPANVMVGEFGEVLVMDWGLAREVRSAELGVRSEDNEPSSTPHSEFRTPHLAETVAGQVKGTPAYMAPEQARGEPVDARADVFALGGILAAMLTGEPPFTGRTVMDTVLMAAQGELGACFDRLAACAADPELVAVATTCLAPDRADRYADGEAVAAAVAAYRAGVEERLRRAERDTAAAEVRAIEQKRQKRLQMLGIFLMAIVMTAIGGGQQWYERREERRKADAERDAERAAAEQRAADARLDAERRFKAEQSRQGVRSALALAADLRRQFKFRPAGTAVEQAAELVRGAPELAPAVEQARRDLELAVRLDDIRYRKWRWVSAGGGKGAVDPTTATPQYRDALAAYGLDLAALTPADAGARVAASGIRAELVAAIDDWALWEPNRDLRDRLLSAATRADPGEWTGRLRDPAVRTDRAAVARLATEVDLPMATPATVCVLAELMRRAGLDPEPLLTAARAKHPTDFELAFTLARTRMLVRKDGGSIGPYEAARALRPDNVTVWNNLGGLLRAAGDRNGAVAAFRVAIRLDPTFALTHANLGNVLNDTGDTDGAVAAFREAVRLDHKLARAQYSLGALLLQRNDVAGATAAARAAIAADPGMTDAHVLLGECLLKSGGAAGQPRPVAPPPRPADH